MGEGRGNAPLPGRAADAAGGASPAVRRIKAQGTTGIRAGDILTLLRHHDIPCSIDSFSAQGWTAKLGDPAKGFYAQQGRFPTLDAAATWLLEEARRHYPDAFAGTSRADGPPSAERRGGGTSRAHERPAAPVAADRSSVGPR